MAKHCTTLILYTCEAHAYTRGRHVFLSVRRTIILTKTSTNYIYKYGGAAVNQSLGLCRECLKTDDRTQTVLYNIVNIYLL